MNSDLLDRLTDDAVPVRRVNITQFSALYAGGIVATLVIVLWGEGIRADMAQALTTPVFLWKFLAPGLVAALGGVLLLNIGLPGRARRLRAGHLGGLAALLFLVPLGIALLTAPDTHFAAMAKSNWARNCLAGIVIATVPVWIAALVWLRKTAPTNLHRASWTAGLTSAATGTAAFALHCPFDDIGYVGLWYLAAIMGIAAITRAVLPPMIRW